MLDYQGCFLASFGGQPQPSPGDLEKVLWHFIEPGFDERKTNGFIMPDDSKFDHRAGAANIFTRSNRLDQSRTIMDAIVGPKTN